MPTIDFRQRAGLPKYVVYRTFVYETVVLNLDTGTYHGLNPTAGRMLEALERSPSIAAAAEALARDFGRPVEEIKADLSSFCGDLASRGLIVLTDVAD